MNRFSFLLGGTVVNASTTLVNLSGKLAKTIVRFFCSEESSNQKSEWVKNHGYKIATAIASLGYSAFNCVIENGIFPIVNSVSTIQRSFSRVNFLFSNQTNKQNIKKINFKYYKKLKDNSFVNKEPYEKMVKDILEGKSYIFASPYSEGILSIAYNLLIGRYKLINCLFKDKEGKKIVCRHLAAEKAGINEHFLTTGYFITSKKLNNSFNKIIKEVIQNKTGDFFGISNAEVFYNNEFDYKRIGFRASEYIVFNINPKEGHDEIPSLTNQLIAIMEIMKLGEKQRLLIVNENHAMKMQINLKKSGVIKISLYDPNFYFDTTINKVSDCVLIANKENFIKKMPLILKFITPYFFKNLKMGVIKRYGAITPVIQNLKPGNGKELKELIFIQMSFGFETGKLKDQIKDILNGSLSSQEKIDLLQAKNKDGFIGFYAALANGHLEAVKVFLDCVLNSSLATEEKVELLQANYSEGYSGFYAALSHGHTEAVRVFLDCVLNSSLATEEKVELLLANHPEGYSGFYATLTSGCAKTAEVFLDSILNSALSSKEKVELLQANHPKGYSGFYWTLTQGCAKTAKVFLDSILNSSLSSQEKMDLLQAKTKDGFIGFYVALVNGHTEGVKVFLDCVLNSPLSSQEKVELLQANHTKGWSGFYGALVKGHTEIVMLYVNFVLNSRLFPQEKMKLLDAQRQTFSSVNNEAWRKFKNLISCSQLTPSQKKQIMGGFQG